MTISAVVFLSVSAFQLLKYLFFRSPLPFVFLSLPFFQSSDFLICLSHFTDVKEFHHVSSPLHDHLSPDCSIFFARLACSSITTGSERALRVFVPPLSSFFPSASCYYYSLRKTPRPFSRSLPPKAGIINSTTGLRLVLPPPCDRLPPSFSLPPSWSRFGCSSLCTPRALALNGPRFQGGGSQLSPLSLTCFFPGLWRTCFRKISFHIDRFRNFLPPLLTLFLCGPPPFLFFFPFPRNDLHHMTFVKHLHRRRSHSKEKIGLGISGETLFFPGLLCWICSPWSVGACVDGFSTLLYALKRTRLRCVLHGRRRTLCPSCEIPADSPLVASGVDIEERFFCPAARRHPRPCGTPFFPGSR